MPYEFMSGRIRKAIKTENGATMLINGTPEADYWVCVYEVDSYIYSIGLRIKFAPPESVTEGVKISPAICLTASDLIGAFAKHPNLNADQIKAILEEMVSMIAFISKKYPIGQNHYVWSDFEFYAHKDPKVAAHLQGYVPKNIELMRLSCPDD